jgi:hypothetical protein
LATRGVKLAGTVLEPADTTAQYVPAPSVTDVVVLAYALAMDGCGVGSRVG